MSNEAATCGAGMAAHAPLPAALAALSAAVADILEGHMPGIVRSDPNGQHEYEAYELLASQHRKAASRLSGIAAGHEACRDLPAAEHDMEALTSPANLEAFASLVAAEDALLDLLQQRLADDRSMLDQMRAAISPGA